LALFPFSITDFVLYVNGGLSFPLTKLFAIRLYGSSRPSAIMIVLEGFLILDFLTG
jgi:hypothetical protein